MLVTTEWMLLLALAVVVLVGGLVQGAAGFGVSLVILPALAAAYPQLMVVTNLLLGLVAVTWILVKDGVPDLGSWVTLSAGRIPGTAFGAWMVSQLAPERLRQLAGITILFGVVSINARRIVIKVDRRSQAISGVLSGILSTTVGAGGPPLALLYANSTATELRSVIAGVSAFGNTLSLAALIMMGEVHVQSFWLAAALSIPLVIGLASSVAASRHMSSRQLRTTVSVISTVAAVAIFMGLGR